MPARPSFSVGIPPQQTVRHAPPLRLPLLCFVVPLTIAAFCAWPLLALTSLVPLLGFVSLPSLLLCTASLLALVPATLHLVFAQPHSPSPPFLPRLRLFSPLANLRLAHWTVLVLYDLYASSLVSLVFDTLTKRVLLLGGRDAARIVVENIPYVPAGVDVEGGADGHAPALRLDVYLPQGRDRDLAELAPVVLLLPAPSYRLAALRSFPAPLIALRLARLGACVVVPALGAYSGAEDDGRTVEREVAQVRAALGWIAEHARTHSGDAERVTLLGFGAGAHVGLLALVQSAVVSARESLLAAEKVRERERAETGRAGEERAQISVDSAESAVGTPRGPAGRGLPELDSSSPHPQQFPEGPSSTAPAAGTSSVSPSTYAAAAAAAPSQFRSATYADTAASPPSSHSTFHTSSEGEGLTDDDADPLERYASPRPLSQPLLPTDTEPAPPLGARDIPAGVRDCPLWTLQMGTSAGAGEIEQPEQRGEALAACAVRDTRGRERGRVRVTGAVLIGGVYDVVKQGRWEESWGAGEVSSLVRVCHSLQRDILQACPSHLLYAASPLLPPSVDTLLPPRFLLVHGGRDPLVPFAQATLLRNLLVGIGVEEVRLRLCRDEGGLGALASLMHPTRYSPLILRELEEIVFRPAPPVKGASLSSPARKERVPAETERESVRSGAG